MHYGHRCVWETMHMKVVFLVAAVKGLDYITGVGNCSNAATVLDLSCL